MALSILASLRSARLAELDEELAALEAGGCDGLHLDVMDGQFVAERCFEPATVVDLVQRTKLPVDVHLLCSEPERLVDPFAAAGASRIAVHVEAVGDTGACLARIRETGCKAGLVLLPFTPLGVVEPWLDQLDFVNPLGVDPTRGMGFQERSFARVEQLRAWRDERGLDFRLQGDGGVWSGTRDAFVAAGVDELVGGYPIFSRERSEYGQAIAELRDGTA